EACLSGYQVACVLSSQAESPDVNKQSLVKIFLASPGDLRAERASVNRVVCELNNTWADYVGINLRVLGWETHTWPALGSDAQDVVNREMGDDYRVLIAIFGARLGSPTPRAASGTVEEIERAVSRERRRPGSVEIMVYFKEVKSPTPEIVQFRKRIDELGVYYWSFTSRQNLEKAVRIHLSRQIQVFARRDLALPREERKFRQVEPARLEGIARAMEELTCKINLGADGVAKHSERYTGYLEDFTRAANTATLRLRRLAQPGLRQPAGGQIGIVDRFGKQMDELAERLRAEGNELMEVYRESFRAMSDLVVLVAPLAPVSTPVDSLLGQVLETSGKVARALLGVRTAQGELRESVAGVSSPPSARSFSAGKIAMMGVLDFLDEEFTTAIRLTRDIGLTVESMLA
ncbi:MAG TPA: hypothetical protein VF179_01220, partial [Thermoanaerobaculia bacterium]|nr:hypothetical protein [Thermoanaerobaculia bacterium]